MSLTFHTPNFGDEEFEIPSFNIPQISNFDFLSAGGGAPYQQTASHLAGPGLVRQPHPAQNFPAPYTCVVSTGYTQSPLGYRGPPVLPKFPPQSFDGIPDISQTQADEEQQIQQHQQQQQNHQQQHHQQNQQQHHNHLSNNIQAEHNQTYFQQPNQHQHHQQQQQRQHHPQHSHHPHLQQQQQQQQHFQHQSFLGSLNSPLFSPLAAIPNGHNPVMENAVDKTKLTSSYGLRTASQRGGVKKGANSPGSRESEDSSDDSLPLAQLSAPGNTGKRGSSSPSNRGGAVAKKSKAAKKRKKKDPNEPQKPVSAYALFFRDRQAAIKGANPNASFGEISKIVASMWDGLADDEKQIYKKRTEDAKKEYLKQLAAYRANLVSQGALDPSDHDKSNSPPQSMMSSQRHLMSGPAQPEPILSSFGMGSQTTPLTHMGDPSNGSPLMHDPMGAVPQQMMSMQQQQQQQQGMSPMAQHMEMSPQHIAMTTGSPSHLGMQSASPPHVAMATGSPQHMGMAASPPQVGMSVTGSYAMDSQVMGSPDHMGSPGANVCVRNGCVNPAIDSPRWDSEYCSNDCVVSHCRDVFTAWVAARQGSSGAYASVK